MDQKLTIRIEGDASGAAASFTFTEEQLKKLKSSLDEIGPGGITKIPVVAKEAEYSMMEARHSAMLFGEETGVHIPRAVASMLASIGPVGAIMAAAFPILAAVALFEVVSKGIEKFNKWYEALSNITAEEQKAFDQATKVAKENLKNVEAQIKGTYDLAIAQAHGDPIKQAALKVEMQKSLISAQSDYVGGLLKGINTENAAIAGLEKELAIKKESKDITVSEAGAVIETPENTAVLEKTIEKKKALVQSYVVALGAAQTEQLKGSADLQNSENQSADAYAAAQQNKERSLEHRMEIERKGEEARTKALNKQMDEDVKEGELASEADRALAASVTEQADRKIESRLKQMEADHKLAEAEAKLADVQAKASLESGIGGIKLRVAEGLESQRTANEQMAALYQADAARRLAAEQNVVSQIQSEEKLLRAGIADAILRGDTKEVEALQRKLADEVAREKQAQGQIIAIRTETSQRVQQLALQEANARTKYENQFNSMFANSVGQVLTGHQTITQAALKMFEEMTLAMIKHFIMKEMKRVEDLALEKLGLAQSTGSHVAAAAANKAISTAEGTANAGVAATSAAAEAGIAAPAVAAVTFAAVEPFAFMERGGMSTGGMTLMHPREAVLNPVQTENFQRMAEGGGGRNVTFSPVVHVHGDFDTEQHFPEIWHAFSDKMKFMGANF